MNIFSSVILILFFTPAYSQDSSFNNIIKIYDQHDHLSKVSINKNIQIMGVIHNFTTYAENLFGGGKEFWIIVDHSPKVKEKALLTIAFYHHIYSIFTENWFRFVAEYRLV